MYVLVRNKVILVVFDVAIRLTCCVGLLSAFSPILCSVQFSKTLVRRDLRVGLTVYYNSIVYQ